MFKACSLSEAGLCVLAAFPLFVHADEAPARLALQLPTVSVAASRVEKPLNETAPSVAVLEPDSPLRAPVRDIKDLVRMEPGVSVLTDPSRRGHAGYTIRGIDGNRVLMLVDGVRLPDQYKGGGGSGAIAGRDYTELDSLKSVEILKGPFSGSYGSDAIGGVVAYRTLGVEDLLAAGESRHVSVKGFAHSADRSVGGSATLAGRSEALSALVRVTHRDGQETDNRGDADLSGSQGSLRSTPNPQRWHSDNVLAKLGFKPADGHALTLTYERFRRDTDTELISSQTSAIVAQPVSDSVSRDRVSLAHAMELNLPWLKRAQWQVYWQNMLATEKARESRTGNIVRLTDNTFEQTQTGAQAQLESRFAAFNAAHSLVYGVEASRSETSRLRDRTQINANGSTSKLVAGEPFPQRNFPDSTSDRLGVFVQDEMRWDNGLSLTPGVRFDWYRMRPHTDALFNVINPNNYPIATFKDSALSPKLTAAWQVSEPLTLFAQAATGFRAPPFDDATMAFANRTYGYEVLPNANLKSERSRGLELGVKGEWTGLSLAATAFYNRYSDFLEQTLLSSRDTNGNGVPLEYQVRNVGRVNIHGLEFKGQWQFAPHWQLGSSLAWAQGDNQTTGQPQDTVDPLKWVLNLGYRGEQWGVSGYLTAVARKSRVSDPSYFRPGGYQVLDLSGYWQLSKAARVTVGVNNLFDRRYWQWSDMRGQLASDPALPRYTQPGRNLSASFEYRFL
ncbi:TonB-dependent hemoglobin/transferrin/lactoferrin family receptor [Aquaspirillum sp. LM1]|uniref:TonB-dependent hemoglobin/transferrin/lactoferrin family receptor n=1 Tax=Aquaspirillum sp. LM1 TaxID=1938604 RepID=UPI000987C942|nr:TonB-dependent hemoglobin/transferrin/lactoferrin family receptor [Aquaspirillum sp. LM1]